ncbi:hypothetical protein GCM10009668_36680 [Nocardioides dubius]|uniref:Uncharacterized protein n=1 Tax=Nocardioides dubius TaxID=317019 RepID=A0ABP4EJD0_9ACTN
MRRTAVREVRAGCPARGLGALAVSLANASNSVPCTSMVAIAVLPLATSLDLPRYPIPRTIVRSLLACVAPPRPATHPPHRGIVPDVFVVLGPKNHENVRDYPEGYRAKVTKWGVR